MTSIILKNITKIYNRQVTAVDNLNLEIAANEFMVLVGPSGCGKSTVLRMIAGLESITAGEILIDGVRVNDVPAKDRNIAMVFQNYALYPHMTVYGNMAFGLKLRKLPRREIEARIQEAVEILHIRELLQRRPQELSGGQRQRVAVGRAIVRKPKLFLFDEPLSNLDAKLRVQMRVEISRLFERLGTTMLYVTHDQVEAMTLGSRIVVMKDGLLQQIGPPLDLYNNPRNQFVAGFIGNPAMNFFSGRLIRDGDLRFESELIRFTLPENLKSALESYTREQVVLGIRPENIHLLDGPAPEYPCRNNKPIRVDVIEPVGNETFVYFQGHQTSHCLRVPAHYHLKHGETRDINFNSRKIYLFDAETGRRID